MSKVLVVDDKESIRSALERMLQKGGLEVASARNGERALKVASSSPEEDRVRGIEAGTDDFISRSFEWSGLTARVRSLLRPRAYTGDFDRAEIVLFALARAIEAKDPYTRGHCERLSVYSQKLALRLQRPEEEVVALSRAGVVHDVGKVAVPDAILLKNGRLTSDEMAIVKRHPVIGHEICSGLGSLGLVLPIIRHHHEKWNGTGYPDGLQGEDIPLTARILQVVDVYDALTTERPYKPAFSMEESLGIMRAEVARGWWDPEVFRAFGDLVGEEGFGVTDAGAIAVFQGSSEAVL